VECLLSRAFECFDVLQTRCGGIFAYMIKHGGRDIAGDYAAIRSHAFGRLDGLAPGAASQIQNSHAKPDTGHIHEHISCGG
jgi:hypothetical protein